MRHFRTPSAVPFCEAKRQDESVLAAEEERNLLKPLLNKTIGELTLVDQHCESENQVGAWRISPAQRKAEIAGQSIAPVGWLREGLQSRGKE
jgi:hypothetical protein